MKAIVYIIIWLNIAASVDDKRDVKTAIENNMLNGEKIEIVDLQDNWRLKANPAVTGMVLVVAVDNMEQHNVTDWATMKEKMETWRATHMDNTNHLQVRKNADWIFALTNAGLERVEVKQPMP